MRFKFLLLSVALFIATQLTAQNKISLSSAQGHPGDTVTVELSLQNSEYVTAVEIQVPLERKQLTFVEGSCVLNGERANGHSISAAVVNDILRIYVYSMSLNNLKGNDGNLLSFGIKLGALPKEYTLQPQAILSNDAGSKLTVTTQNGAATILSPQIEVVTKKIDYGHIPIRSTYNRVLTLRNSGNELLTVSQLQFSSGEFSANETSFVLEAGATKSVTVQYSPVARGAIEETVTVLSNAINGNVSALLVADPFSVNELHSSAARGVSDEEVTVELRMNNMEPIVAMQCSFALPEQLEYVDGSFVVAERAASHTASAVCSNGKLTLLLFSSSNTCITGNDGVVATFRLRLDGRSGNYFIAPQNTVLSNVTLENMTSAVKGGSISISSPAISCNSELSMGFAAITEKAKASYSIKNTGRAPLTVSGVAFLSSGYNVVNEFPLVVPESSSATLDIEYTPTAEGRHSTTMNIYTNDPNNRMKSVAVNGDIYEPNNILVEGENMQDGSYMLSVYLDNYTDIVAFQMDINWLNGMHTSNEQLTASSRLDGFTSSVTQIDADTYRVVAFSLTNKAIEGNSGKLFDIIFRAEEGVEYRNTNISVDNLFLSNAASSNYASQKQLSALAEYKNFMLYFMLGNDTLSNSFLRAGSEISVPDAPSVKGYIFGGWNEHPSTMPAEETYITAILYKRGDVNIDNAITVADADGVMDVLLNKESDELKVQIADITEDGKVSVTDIAGVVNVALGDTVKDASVVPATLNMAAGSDACNSLRIAPFALSAGEEKEIKVLMNNPGDAFCNIQFDLYLPEGVEVLTDDKGYYVGLGSRTTLQQHSNPECAMQADGALRIACASLSNATFKNESGDVLVITVKGSDTLQPGVYELQMKNIELARPNVTNDRPCDYTASVVADEGAASTLTLKGDFTADALADLSTALSNNKEITSIDLTDAIAVDATGVLTTGNPNTLILLAEGRSVANEQNVVSGGICTSLALHDGYTFNAPVSFTAEQISYDREIEGAEIVTFVLPVAVPADAVNGNVYSLNAVEETRLQFDTVTEGLLLANTPYLASFEDAAPLLNNEALKSSVTIETTPKEIVVTTGGIKHIGSYAVLSITSDNTKSYYECMHGEFVKTNSGMLSPFRTMLLAEEVISFAPSYSIVLDNATTSLQFIDASDKSTDVYDLSGRLVRKQAESFIGLQKGIYIVNDRKLLIK